MGAERLSSDVKHQTLYRHSLRKIAENKYMLGLQTDAGEFEEAMAEGGGEMRLNVWLARASSALSARRIKEQFRCGISSCSWCCGLTMSSNAAENASPPEKNLKPLNYKEQFAVRVCNL